MAAGLPDRVDCMRLAAEGVVLERQYALASMPRLKDLLDSPAGTVEARIAFERTAAGRAAARVQVRAAPRLVCQRCLQGFEYPVASSSRVEFSDSEAEAGEDGEETFLAPGGVLSLRELAEEETLLALPIVPMCADPQRCGRAPLAAPDAMGAEETGRDDQTQRPFADLRNLLNRT